MAFSSYIGGNTRRGGGWAHSLLPTRSSSPNPKSRHSRKSRKRTALRDFIFANFFTIGLSLSLIFFFVVIYRYGIPKPFSSHFRNRNSRLQKLRKPAYRKPTVLSDGDVVSSAVVDMTTKDLYDKIKFSDVDGGPWKQGWKVSYQGDQWDSEKLKVFVVPHSHNDPGWKFTVEEYYDRQSRHILDTIIETLSKDVRRKFIWEEMSYLERWWRDASESKRGSFIKLVKKGQLEIVGGGWVMNDEVKILDYLSMYEEQVLGTLEVPEI